MFLQATSYKLKPSSGYTLIEAIIYIAILAVLAVTFISLLFTMTRAYVNFRLTRDIVSSSSLALERMIGEIRRAEAVNVSSALPDRLVLDTTDNGGSATTMVFFLSSGVLMIKEGSGAAASTTSARVVVDNLVFRQTNTPESSAVKVEMTLSASRGEVTRTEKFYATAVLRGSY